jgi:putative endonuclease
MSSNNKNTIYIGVTNNLQRRIIEHKNNTAEGFTSKYNCVNLVYFESFNNIDSAIKREKKLKKWNRGWKDDLINKDNHLWVDLSIDWD